MIDKLIYIFKIRSNNLDIYLNVRFYFIIKSAFTYNIIYAAKKQLKLYQFNKHSINIPLISEFLDRQGSTPGI